MPPAPNERWKAQREQGALSANKRIPVLSDAPANIDLYWSELHWAQPSPPPHPSLPSTVSPQPPQMGLIEGTNLTSNHMFYSSLCQDLLREPGSGRNHSTSCAACDLVCVSGFSRPPHPADDNALHVNQSEGCDPHSAKCRAAAAGFWQRTSKRKEEGEKWVSVSFSKWFMAMVILLPIFLFSYILYILYCDSVRWCVRNITMFSPSIVTVLNNDQTQCYIEDDT